MNKDSHLLFEAYKKINEAFEYFGPKGTASEDSESKECGKGCTCGKCPDCMPDEATEEPKKSKHSRGHYEGAAKVVHHVLKDKHDGSELAEHMKKHMKKIYGDDYDEKKAEHAIKKATNIESKSEDNEDDMKCTGKPDCKCKKCMGEDEETM